ncbi:glutaredoxin family protein [Bacillus lacus]|uniref:Glutaredoxin family protein n=1 Tax=Metabacillus lacus TaxID=1983721 RepID=A0A7X2M025_9BACI|nr:glutaredoxin family protein [Metabacillus lacus]MRX72319.1 glutaredoxin family protein [Metabacillus lacus]
MLSLTVYSRAQCPLCDKAILELNALQEELPFHYHTVDIYGDDALLEQYQLMIPVVVHGEDILQYGLIRKEHIRKRLLEKMGD